MNETYHHFVNLLERRLEAVQEASKLASVTCNNVVTTLESTLGVSNYTIDGKPMVRAVGKNGMEPFGIGIDDKIGRERAIVDVNIIIAFSEKHKMEIPLVICADVNRIAEDETIQISIDDEPMQSYKTSQNLPNLIRAEIVSLMEETLSL